MKEDNISYIYDSVSTPFLHFNVNYKGVPPIAEHPRTAAVKQTRMRLALIKSAVTSNTGNTVNTARYFFKLENICNVFSTFLNFICPL